MCGISGLYLSGEGADGALFEAFTNTLRHRGPDDEGYLAYDCDTRTASELWGRDSHVQPGNPIQTLAPHARRLLLGHRRLSIIDLSTAGHQPMSYENGSFWLIFNGEIYNYLEIRELLKAKGRRFRTNTDTEVVLASFAEWGPECLHEFNGMWSFVLLDTLRNELFGARDRFGVKPFYYTVSEGAFAFASEIKALLKLPWVERQVNHDRLYDYLMWGNNTLSGDTFFSRISELPPGHFFRFKLNTGELEVKRYYSLSWNPDLGSFDPVQFEGHRRKVQELVFDAVRLRLRADVSVGSCLSGGLDSSSVVVVINELLRRESIPQVGVTQKVLTACYHDPKIDEGPFAADVVGSTSTEWYRTFPTGAELLDDLEQLIYIQDEPFGSSSIYAQYRVMRLAQDAGLKVLLDGQGGDEVFTGYVPFHAAFLFDLLRNGRFLSLVGELKNLNHAPVGIREVGTEVLKYVATVTLPDSWKVRVKRLKSPEAGYIARGFAEVYRGRNTHVDEMAIGGSLNEVLARYLTSVTLPRLLRFEDRNSMAFSIEARTPYADDHHLIEYVYSIPGIYKVRNGWSKYLLREAVGPLLPPKVRWRTDKKGFSTPAKSWLTEIVPHLKHRFSRDNRFIDTHRLNRDCEALVKEQSADKMAGIWRLLDVLVWMEIFRLD